jgi:hypothetical protein
MLHHFEISNRSLILRPVPPVVVLPPPALLNSRDPRRSRRHIRGESFVVKRFATNDIDKVGVKASVIARARVPRCTGYHLESSLADSWIWFLSSSLW